MSENATSKSKKKPKLGPGKHYWSLFWFLVTTGLPIGLILSGIYTLFPETGGWLWMILVAPHGAICIYGSIMRYSVPDEHWKKFIPKFWNEN